MKLKTKDGDIEFGDWELDNGEIYYLRKDLSKPRGTSPPYNKWNNAVGFLIKNGLPRFFGDEVNFLIQQWHLIGDTLSPTDIEKNKKTIDNFIQLFD